jgi:hypothetical protein
LLLLFWLVIPSAASEPAFSRFSLMPSQILLPVQPIAFRFCHAFLGDTSKEREEAGSLAALGMTNKKSKNKNNCGKNDRTLQASLSCK